MACLLCSCTRAERAQRRPLLINHPLEPALGPRILLLKAKPFDPFMLLSEGVEFTSPFFFGGAPLAHFIAHLDPKRLAAVAFSRFFSGIFQSGNSVEIMADVNHESPSS